MTAVHTVTRARCLHPGCDWPTQEGDPATVDRAAEKHTKKEGHPTETTTIPAKGMKE